MVLECDVTKMMYVQVVEEVAEAAIHGTLVFKNGFNGTLTLSDGSEITVFNDINERLDIGYINDTQITFNVSGIQKWNVSEGCTELIPIRRPICLHGRIVRKDDDEPSHFAVVDVNLGDPIKKEKEWYDAMEEMHDYWMVRGNS